MHTVGWIVLVIYIDAAQANCTSADASSARNAQTRYLAAKAHHCRILLPG